MKQHPKKHRPAKPGNLGLPPGGKPAYRPQVPSGGKPGPVSPSMEQILAAKPHPTGKPRPGKPGRPVDPGYSPGGARPSRPHPGIFEPGTSQPAVNNRPHWIPQQKVTKEQALAKKNAELAKQFKGPRTYKAADGSVKATAEWEAFLKKHGSKVVRKQGK